MTVPTFSNLSDFATYVQSQAQTLSSQISSSDWPNAQNTYGLISESLPQSGAFIGALAQQTQGSTYSGPISASVADIQQQLNILQTILFSLTGQSSSQVQTAQQAAAQIQSDASDILTQVASSAAASNTAAANAAGAAQAAAEAAAAAAAQSQASTTTTTDPSTGIVTTTTSDPSTGQTTTTTTDPSTGQSSTVTTPTPAPTPGVSMSGQMMPSAAPVTASVPVVVAVGLGCAAIAGLLVWMAHQPAANPVPYRRRTRGRRRAR